MDVNKPLLTITELARVTGIPSRTIRFWSDEGLIPVAGRSAARYRLYDHDARLAVDLVRTLRELGLGLSEVATILRRQRSLTQVATTHVAALDARIRALRLQRSVLRVVIRRGATPEETQTMQKLLQVSAAERRRLVDEFVSRAFEGIPRSAPGALIADAMRSLPPELPDEPSDAHVEAWLELVGLLADPDFQSRVRRMALTGAAAPRAQAVDIEAIRKHASAAVSDGVAPGADEAWPVVERILARSTSAAERLQLREQLETFHDVRVERYWQLMGILNNRPPFPPVAAACQWFIDALRARE